MFVRLELSEYWYFLLCAVRETIEMTVPAEIVQSDLNNPTGEIFPLEPLNFCQNIKNSLILNCKCIRK